MVFQKAISGLRNLAPRKAKKASKKGDISANRNQTARGVDEEIQFNLDAERTTEQQANSSKQRQSKKTCFSRIRGGNKTKRCFKFDV